MTSETVKLIYQPKPGFECPGEGWPAADHEEPSVRLAARKIKSGFYRDRYKKEVTADDSASKKAVNEKAKTQATSAIEGADAAVSEAREAAHRTRVEHGRAK